MRKGGLENEPTSNGNGKSMINSRSVASLFLVALCLVGCGKDNLDAPKEFFESNKIGSSPDFGVMKFGTDHVISVHGFADDLAVCQQVARALNTDACKELGGRGCLDPFSCRPLNH